MSDRFRIYIRVVHHSGKAGPWPIICSRPTSRRGLHYKPTSQDTFGSSVPLPQICTPIAAWSRCRITAYPSQPALLFLPFVSDTELGFCQRLPDHDFPLAQHISKLQSYTEPRYFLYTYLYRSSTNWAVANAVALRARDPAVLIVISKQPVPAKVKSTWQTTLNLRTPPQSPPTTHPPRYPQPLPSHNSLPQSTTTQPCPPFQPIPRLHSCRLPPLQQSAGGAIASLRRKLLTPPILLPEELPLQSRSRSVDEEIPLCVRTARHQMTQYHHGCPTAPRTASLPPAPKSQMVTRMARPKEMARDQGTVR